MATQTLKLVPVAGQRELQPSLCVSGASSVSSGSASCLTASEAKGGDASPRSGGDSRGMGAANLDASGQGGGVEGLSASSDVSDRPLSGVRTPPFSTAIAAQCSCCNALPRIAADGPLPVEQSRCQALFWLLMLAILAQRPGFLARVVFARPWRKLVSGADFWNLLMNAVRGCHVLHMARL